MAKILLINSVIREFAPPNNTPLGLLYIASVLEEHGHECDICDLNALRWLNKDREYWLAKYYGDYDFIGLSGLIVTYQEQRRTLDFIVKNRKKYGYPVLISGGGLATSAPEFAFRHMPELDLLVMGEGEMTMLELADGVKALHQIPGIAYRDNVNRFTRNVSRELIPDLDILPFPAWDKVPIEPVYIKNPIWGGIVKNSSKIAYQAKRSMNMINSRGCPRRCRFCLSGDTLILMVDGSSKQLTDIEVGDKIVGIVGGTPDQKRKYSAATVEAKWETLKPAVRISVENGTTVVCSPNHRWLTNRGWKYTTGKMSGVGQRPYLTTNNSIRGMGYINETPEVTDIYRRGYLSGIIAGDGTLKKFYCDNGTGRKYDRYRFRLAMKDTEGVERAAEYLEHFGVNVNRFEMNVKDGYDYTMPAIRKYSRDAYGKIKELTKHSDHPDFQRGYLAGIFDAEGSLCKATIRICNKDRNIIYAISKALYRLGFDRVLEVNKSTGLSVVRVRGGISEALRFFQLTNPAIVRKKLDITCFNLQSGSKIVSVEPLNEIQPMYDITTSTGNFIANGLVSHNCFHYVFGKKYRMRSVDNVIAEIATLKDKYHIDFVGFVDDNTSANRTWVQEFCEKLIGEKLDMHWGCSARVDQVDPDILKLMKAAGCEFIGYGGESACPDILRAMNKKHTPEQMAAAIRMTRDADIWANMTFIAGYPPETKGTLAMTAKFMRENDMLGSMFFVTPYPGTELYDQSLEYILAKYGTEDAYIMSLADATDFRVNLSQMSDEDLMNYRKMAMKGEVF
jgi:radical SAM superfamily enzyme YgiQ (UPF0313 family)/intein-encoded DNA endonuclease-like protein